MASSDTTSATPVPPLCAAIPEALIDSMHSDDKPDSYVALTNDEHNLTIGTDVYSIVIKRYTDDEISIQAEHNKTKEAYANTFSPKLVMQLTKNGKCQLMPKEFCDLLNSSFAVMEENITITGSITDTNQMLLKLKWIIPVPWPALDKETDASNKKKSLQKDYTLTLENVPRSDVVKLGKIMQDMNKTIERMEVERARMIVKINQMQDKIAQLCSENHDITQTLGKHIHKTDVTSSGVFKNMMEIEINVDKLLKLFKNSEAKPDDDLVKIMH